jgi:hypothetical protein
MMRRDTIDDARSRIRQYVDADLERADSRPI